MKKRFRILGSLVLSLVLLAVAATGAAGDWRDEIGKLAGGGAVLVRGPDGGDVYARNPEKALMPASTLKVVTCAAALDALGPDYRFVTEFRYNSEGDLYIIGHGDPYLISEELAGIARTLKGKGLRRVRDIYVDNAWFSPGLVLDGTSRSLKPYDAYNGALCVNFNTINAVIGKGGQVESAEPQTPMTNMARDLAKESGRRGKVRFNLAESPRVCVLYAGDLIRVFMESVGVEVIGQVKLASEKPDNPELLYRHQSTKPLSWLMGQLLEYSNNFMTNQIFLTMGAEKYGPPATAEKGRRVVEAFFKARRIESFHVEEGSGLSRKTQVTARQMAAVLDVFAPFRELLNREGHALVKTGTLRDVNSMVGYIEAPGGALYTFVILLNGNYRYGTRDKILDVLLKNLT